MEKFMFIFHGGQLPSDQQTPENMQVNMGKWLAWIDKLKNEGHYESGEPLLPGGKIVSKGNVVTDGPFVEGKDVVGGFFIVKAKDYSEAVSLLKDYPDYANNGTVQVRQIMKM